MRKALVTIIILFVLAILLLAFIKILGRFPDEWEWVGIVLGWVAIAMAAPCISQMFWGRACLETEVEASARAGERSLLIFLKNPPVKNRMLKALGVKRETVQSLTAEIRIAEFGSKKVIVPIRHLRLYPDDDASDVGSARIALPPTYSVAASMIVVTWDNNSGQAVVPGDRNRQPLTLGEGYYLALIILLMDGEPTKICQPFVVGKNADDLMWGKAN